MFQEPSVYHTRLWDIFCLVKSVLVSSVPRSAKDKPVYLWFCLQCTVFCTDFTHIIASRPYVTFQQCFAETWTNSVTEYMDRKIWKKHLSSMHPELPKTMKYEHIHVMNQQDEDISVFWNNYVCCVFFELLNIIAFQSICVNLLLHILVQVQIGVLFSCCTWPLYNAALAVRVTRHFHQSPR